MNKNIKLYEYLLFIDFDNTYFIEKKIIKLRHIKILLKKLSK